MWVRGQYGPEVPRSDRKYLGVIQSYGIGGTFPAIQSCNLAKNISDPHVVQYDLFAIHTGIGQFDPSLGEHHQAVARISSTICDGSFDKSQEPPFFQQIVNYAARQSPQKCTLRQEGANVTFLRGERAHGTP